MRVALTLPLGSGGPSSRTGTTVYRPDIDGLRALAVVAVVLFHAGLGPTSGGFIGVDVFFVISGFLITRMIDKELISGQFSLLQFYERRVRRIFPALFAVLFVSAILAALLFIPSDFQKFGRNAAGTAAFISNFVLWAQGSYFESTEARPLLHTWSLGIEEQFYLLFPPLLVALRRRWSSRVIPLIGGAALLSFGVSLFALAAQPSAAFYLPQYRMWELLCGSLLAVGAVPSLPNDLSRDFAGIAGIVLIIIATIDFTEATAFPGMSALLPCLGTVLIIHSGEVRQTAISRILASKPAVATGLISYSVYLWHWPLIVFFTYYNIDEPTSLQSVVLVVCSFAVSALSWRFIEVPFRRAKARSSEHRMLAFAVAAGAIAITLLVGSSIYLARGFPQRFPSNVGFLAGYAFSQNPRADRCSSTNLQLEPNSPCTIGDPRKARLFLWGDSHAGALYGALEAISRSGPSTVYGATPRCPPLLGIGTDADCIAGNQRRLDYVLQHSEISTVIIAARWALYARGRATKYGPAETNTDLPVLEDGPGQRYPQFTLEARQGLRQGLYDLIKVLLAADKHVVLVYPVPEMGYDIPSMMARLTAEGRMPSSFSTSERQYFHRQRFSIPLLDGLGHPDNLSRVHPDRALCSLGRCLGYIDGIPLYFDSHHLSIPGSRRLEPILRAALRERAGG